MATVNPFVAGLQSFAADPEGEAKGRYITANTAKTQNEADILADRIKYRKIFGGATNLNPTTIAGELSNPTVDTGAAAKATGTLSGQRMLFDTDAQGNLVPKRNAWGMPEPVDPKTFGLASLLMGHNNEVVSRSLGSAGFDKPASATRPTPFSTTDIHGVTSVQAVNTDGSLQIKPDGSPVMVALNPDVQKVYPTSVAGGENLVVKNGKAEKLVLPGSRMIDPGQFTQAIKIAHATDANSRGTIPNGMNNIEFLIAKKIGHIDGSGKPTSVPMLNPDEVQSIQRLVGKIMAEDSSITLSNATAAAIDHHDDLAKGNVSVKDYDNRGFLDNFLYLGGADNEKDAAGVELPQFKGKEYTTSNTYKRAQGEVNPERESRGRYSNLPEDAQIVPLSVRLAGNAVNETGIPQIMAGATGRPEFSTKLKRDAATNNPIGLEAGKFYHENGNFYVADWGPNGAITARLITNIKK